MMKQHKKKILIIFALLLVMIAIFFLIFIFVKGRKTIDYNGYIEGKDNQYMFYHEGGMCTVQARGTNGTFFSIDHYLYFLEDGTQEAVPLCNKVNCLHDKETDESKKKKCNAYLDAYMVEVESINIAYNDGYVYYIDKVSNDSYGKQILYRLSEDGAQKEQLYEWENDRVSFWCIHRDVLYYVNTVYALPDGENADSANVCSLKKLELNSVFKKEPEDVFAGGEHLDIISIGYLKAYGNYFYFDVYGTIEDEKLTEEEAADIEVYSEIVIYDILKNECYELRLEKSENDEIISFVTFYNDKLIISGYIEDESVDYSNVYIADLDGSNQQVLWKNVPKNTRIHSDGKYLYTSNAMRIIATKEELPVTYHVYNEEYQMVDSFTVPWLYWGQIGASDYLYVYVNNNEQQTLEVLQLDKNEIGALNGKEMSYHPILEIPKDNKHYI